MSGEVRPLIGITADLDYNDAGGDRHMVRDTYIRAVTAAGGLPLIIPNLPGETWSDWLLNHVDGLLLPGGGDVDPVWYDESPHVRLGKINPQRDGLEIPLVRAALAASMPILGICRGCQVLNVAAGGTLYQDLYAQLSGVIRHQQSAPRWHPTHAVEIAPGTRLAAAAGDERARVNSFHHQAVRDVAPELVATAWAPDGVIEALELPGPAFVVGVQWHPEEMVGTDRTARNLFRDFVEAARVSAWARTKASAGDVSAGGSSRE